MSTRREIRRRRFLGCAAAGFMLETVLSARADGAGEGETSYKVIPVGRVEVKEGKAVIHILDKYIPALKGLEEWSHVHVFYWFDRNDTSQKRSILQVHPRGNTANPLTGVFACRSPVRPNLIAFSTCKIKAVDGNTVHVESIDALDGTPVLDLKPFNPSDAPTQGVKVPAWTQNSRKKD